MDTNGRQYINFSRNQKGPNININKDNLAPGLPTLDKTLELIFKLSLSPPTKLSSTLVKKKLYYKMVSTKEAEPKKKINSNIGK